MMRMPRGMFKTAMAVAAMVLGVAGAPSAMAAGYWTDAMGNFVRDAGGNCLRTGSWTPADANAQCDPQLAAFEAPPPAPKPTVQRIDLNADTQFAFDKAVLTDAGKAQLDRIVKALGRVHSPQVQITGYTDRIGTATYNQKLSLRRAEAVRNYLVGHGVPSTAVTVVGKGESDPLVACTGQRGRALVDCLAPNRRSEVSFSALEVVNPTSTRGPTGTTPASGTAPPSSQPSPQ